MGEKRSTMFFESDLLAAAETAAFSLESFGLSEDEVTALAERIEDTIRSWFEERPRV